MTAWPPILDGSPAPPARPLLLRAGPLTLRYAGGDLRSICLGPRELLRRIYAAVRDHNWGTVPARIVDETIASGAESFQIGYTAIHQQGPIDVRWRATIAGAADGTLSFALDGHVHSDFLRNRIGFCVLHPMRECAGASALLEHVDGSFTEARFPQTIVAAQPVEPFAELRALSYPVAEPVWAELRFSGDIFELEDQRNWTDASFKTFCTPLRLPYPAPARAGDLVRQSVTLTLREAPRPGVRGRIWRGAPGGAAGEGPVDIGLTPGAPPCALPRIGLGVAGDGATLDAEQVARLRALHLDHLRVDLRLGADGWRAALERGAAEAQAIGAALELALHLTGAAEAELGALRAACAALRPRVATWLVLRRGALVTPPGLAGLARAALADIAPAARFSGGTDSDFLFVNREPPAMGGLDALSFAINPQVHAFDNASLVETLAAQASAALSARRLAGAAAVHVSPVTLRPRFNPYATAEPPAPAPGELPADVDPRQATLFGAAWTLGSLKYLAESGVASATYYQTSGWRGVLERAAGTPLPERFPSTPGAVFPLYLVLAAVGAYGASAVLPCAASDPLRIEALWLRRGASERLLLANMTALTQTARLTLGGRAARLWQLDASSVAAAIAAPQAFLGAAGAPLALGEALELQLPPYAVAWLDAER